VAAISIGSGLSLLLQSGLPLELEPAAVASPPSNNYFADNGKTWPWYAALTYPSALYVSSTNTTWFVWESYSSGRRVLVTTYNHTTEEWSDDYLVGTSSLANDDHGVPAIARDHEGYIHCFYGAHNGTMIERVTNSVDDPSAWTQRNTFTSGNGFTYPHPVRVGSGMYLIMRIRLTSTSTMPTRLFRTSALSGGVATWGAEEQLVHYAGDTRVYVGQCFLVGTDLHFVTTRANFSDTYRRDIYHYVLDTSTGNVRNADSSVTVLQANRPVDLATSNSSFRLATITDMSNVPGFCVDASGNLHIAYLDGTGSTFDIKHIVFSSGSWSAPETIMSVTNHSRYTALGLAPKSNGEIQLYHSEDAAGSWTRGGNMTLRTRSAGGTWGAASTILSATSYGLEEPQIVRDAHADARVVFCEVAGSSLDSAGGNLKLYAYGDSGFLTRPV
jgi:hypothetical protein